MTPVARHAVHPASAGVKWHCTSVVLGCCLLLLMAGPRCACAAWAVKTQSEQELARQHAQARQAAFCLDTTKMGQIPDTAWRLHDGIKILVYAQNDVVSGAIGASNGWELNEATQIVAALERKIDPASPSYTPPVFVDIGANVGWFTLIAAKWGYQVHAFEGMQKNAQMIRHSLCANPGLAQRVTLYHTGLGASKATCKVQSGIDNVGDGVVDCSHNATLFPGAEWRGTMHINKLDDLLEEDIRVMKVDVEGFEPQVLQGAMSLFRNNKVDHVLTEFNKYALGLFNGGVPGIRTWINTYADLGFNISLTSFSGPFLEARELEALPDKDGIFNLFLTHARVRLGS